MQTQKESKILPAVVITALIVAGISYYFWGGDQAKVASSTQENTVFNQSSKEYAVMGREVWSAFACSAWASIVEDSKEAERLYTFGYEQGKKFLIALQAGKITQEDMSQNVPIGVSMLLQGPNEDFILGRILENAQEDALEDVFKTGDEYNSDELKEAIASNKFRDGNCQLIGK